MKISTSGFNPALRPMIQFAGDKKFSWEDIFPDADRFTFTPPANDSPAMQTFKTYIIKGNNQMQLMALDSMSKFDTDEQLAAFKFIMVSAPKKTQARAALRINELDASVRAKAYKAAIETGDSLVQAQAVLHIPSLPSPEARKEAFQLAFETGNAHVMDEAANSIAYLPVDEQQAAVALYREASRNKQD